MATAERELILDLVLRRSDVVENKKTDGSTAREKEAAWLNIESEFNAASGVKRNHRQLKQVTMK